MTDRVAYLVSRFPKLSETFIVDEIVELRRLDVSIDLYPLVEERESVAHPEARVLARELHAANRSILASLGAAVAWLFERPVTFLSLFFVILRAGWHSPRYLARSVAALLAAGLFARRMRREGVTHVHAHWATHPALAAWAIHRLTDIPYSFTLHADDLFVTQTLLEEKLREADRVVTISRYNAAFLRAHYPDAVGDKLEIVHCGVRTDAFSPAESVSQLDSKPSVMKILCVARLEPKKGHRFLLDACRELAERGVELDCEIVGEGALRSEIEGQIAEWGGTPRARCVGAVTRDRVQSLLRHADVFVLPSVIGEDGRRDGIPVALMEAIAMERAVVATRVSGVPELIEDGQNGLLVEPGDAIGLADAIESIARNPDRARSLGRAARARVRSEFDVAGNGLRMREIVTRASRRRGTGHGVETAEMHGRSVDARLGAVVTTGSAVGER